MNLSNKKKTISVAILLLLMVLIAPIVVFSFLHKERTIEVSANWSQFNRDIVTNFFVLPDNIELISAEQTQYAYMGSSFKVEFRLPNQITPEEWIEVIASNSKINPEFKRSPLKYDCEHDCDLLRLEYISGEKIFVAEAGWD